LIDPSRGRRARANLRANASKLRSRVPALADFVHEYIFALNNIHYRTAIKPECRLSLRWAAR
jgi:hypothetical protein